MLCKKIYLNPRNEMFGCNCKRIETVNQNPKFGKQILTRCVGVEAIFFSRHYNKISLWQLPKLLP